MTETIQLRSATQKISLSPQGAQVVSWQIKDKSGTWQEYLYQGSEIKRTGIPLLFPQFGQSKSLAQHGFGRVSTWKVDTYSENTVTLHLSNAEIDAEWQKVYPFSFVVRLEIELTRATNWTYSLEVANTGTQNLPIAPGLHPYFPISHEHKNQLSVTGMHGFHAAEIDWNAQPPDTSYDWDGQAQIQFPDYTLQITDIRSSTPGKCQFLRVWSQTQDKPDFNFVCFEPVTRDQFGYDNDPVVIKPSEAWRMEVGFGVL